MAYETLSPKMRELVESISAVHDVRLGAGYKSQSPEQQAKDIEANPQVVVPLVRVHPESGRQALFVTDRICSFAGWNEEETKPLLGYVRDHASRYEFQYRHRWTFNDLMVWDYRCTLHLAVHDYDRAQFRLLYRCSLVDRDLRNPVYVPEREAAAAAV